MPDINVHYRNKHAFRYKQVFGNIFVMIYQSTSYIFISLTHLHLQGWHTYTFVSDI
jgi:hypothetical protein